MKKFFLAGVIVVVSFASEYLPFILQAVKQNIKIPIKISYGEITKVEVKGDKTLVMYIKANKRVKFNKKKICNSPLIGDIIKEDGEVKYIFSGKMSGEFIVNQSVCK